MRIKYYEQTDSAVIWLRERGTDTVGEIAGEDLENLETGVPVQGVVLHKDESGELYGIEIYSKASSRLDLDDVAFRRVPAKDAQDASRTNSRSATS